MVNMFPEINKKRKFSKTIFHHKRVSLSLMEEEGNMEECHSIESGWTMYIAGSPTNGDDSDGGSMASDEGGRRTNRDNRDDDDSMASARSYRGTFE